MSEAVNAHDALVAALEAIIGELEELSSDSVGFYWPRSARGSIPNELMPIIDHHVDRVMGLLPRARAALRAAKEGEG